MQLRPEGTGDDHRETVPDVLNSFPFSLTSIPSLVHAAGSGAVQVLFVSRLACILC